MCGNWSGKIPQPLLVTRQIAANVATGVFDVSGLFSHAFFMRDAQFPD
jgi:hypothetical protein